MTLKRTTYRITLLLTVLLVCGQSSPAMPTQKGEMKDPEVPARKDATKNWAALDAALAKDPSNATLWIQRGHEYMDVFEDRKALDCFSKAIKLDPANSSAYVFRSKCYAHLGNVKSSETDLDKACELNKSSAKEANLFVLAAIADRYRDKKKSEDELKVRTQMVSISTNINDLKRKILCEIEMKLYPQAQKDLIAALAKRKDDSEFNTMLGDCYVATKKYRDAAASYTKAINNYRIKDPDLIERRARETLHKRYECYKFMGDKKLELADKKLIDKMEAVMFEMAPFK